MVDISIGSMGGSSIGIVSKIFTFFAGNSDWNDRIGFSNHKIRRRERLCLYYWRIEDSHFVVPLMVIMIISSMARSSVGIVSEIISFLAGKW